MPCRQRQQLGSHARPSRRWARPSAPLWRSPRTPRAHEPSELSLVPVVPAGAGAMWTKVAVATAAAAAGGGWRHGAWAGARPLPRSLDRRRSHRSPSIAPLSPRTPSLVPSFAARPLLVGESQGDKRRGGWMVDAGSSLFVLSAMPAGGLPSIVASRSEASWPRRSCSCSCANASLCSWSASVGFRL